MFITGKTRWKDSLLRQLDIDCSWCGSGVPLPAGEFSGVCIDCGTVMFRPARAGRHGAAEFTRSDIRGNGGSMMPAPA